MCQEYAEVSVDGWKNQRLVEEGNQTTLASAYS